MPRSVVPLTRLSRSVAFDGVRDDPLAAPPAIVQPSTMLSSRSIANEMSIPCVYAAGGERSGSR